MRVLIAVFPFVCLSNLPVRADLEFTTAQTPVDCSQASALASTGTHLYFFRTGIGSTNDGRLYRSTAAATGSWTQLASAASIPGTLPGEIYGGAMAYWAAGNQLVIARWRNPALGGPAPWDNDRAAFYDIAANTWSLHNSATRDELTTGLHVIGNTLYGIQHGGGSPFRRMTLGSANPDEGTGIGGVTGDDNHWFSRTAKLALLNGVFYGIKGDWYTNPRGTGDRLYMIDPSDWGTGPGGQTPATDLGQLPFEVGAGSAIVALPAAWCPGSQGALFIMAGCSPSDHEGGWYTGSNPSAQYAIYDIATGAFSTGALPGASGRGGSAAYHNGRLYIKRGESAPGAFTTDMWIADADCSQLCDLDVTYIERTPRYDYDAAMNNPQPGDTVTFRGHIKNWDHPTAAVDYRWQLDGATVAQGALTGLAAGEERVVTWSWTWANGNHRIKLTADPDGEVLERSELNNEIEDRTNGVIVGFWVEQSTYDYFHQYQIELGIGSNSWEDWAQRQMGFWNAYCASAIHPLTPAGVLDRVRIDKIVVVPDGALPLAGGLPTNNPDLRDKTVDMMWGFPDDLIGGTFYSNHSSADPGNPFYRELSLIHELGHARYLIDHYGFDVHNTASYSQVQILENGVPVAGSAYMPFLAFGEVLYYNQSGGIMGGPYDGWSQHEATAHNLIAGQRAVCGNYNAPCNIGVYLQDLPANNHFRFIDRYGRSRAGANVRVYRATGQPGTYYGKTFDNTYDLEYTTDANGYAHIGGNPFSDGPIQHTFGIANGIMILRIEHAGEIWYRFQEVTDLNLEYWRGHTQNGYYTIRLEGAETMPGDADADGDVDLMDFLIVDGCVDDPGVPAAPGCEGADFDGDGDVDLLDFALMQNAFGP